MSKFLDYTGLQRVAALIKKKPQEAIYKVPLTSATSTYKIPNYSATGSTVDVYKNGIFLNITEEYAIDSQGNVSILVSNTGSNDILTIVHRRYD